MTDQPFSGYRADTSDDVGRSALANGTGHAFAADDWRGPATMPASFTAAPARPSPARLYLNAKAGSPGQERDRAAEILALAKTAVASAFDAARFGKRLNIDSLIPVVDAVAASVARNAYAMPSVARLQTRSEYTYQHSVAVCTLMVGLAQELRLGPDLQQSAGLAGLLHDIGKASIPADLLEKSGPLTEAEFATIRQHPRLGADMVAAMPNIPARVQAAVRHHNERMDGTGYPDQLKAGDLDLIVRMTTLCDVYDAMTSKRLYRNAVSPGQAIAWMKSTRGHFDPALLNVFARMLGAFPPGTLVRLRSDRLAVVVDQIDNNHLSPPVVAFHCTVTNRALPHRRVASTDDPIMVVEDPAKWAFADWPAMLDSMLRNNAAG